MAGQGVVNPIDPAAEANNLASLFYSLSEAVDDFRLTPRDPPLAPLDPTSAGRLKDEAQALDDRAHYFTAQAIGATLQAIQPNLANIKTLTAEAQQQVNIANAVDKVITVVTSALSLGTAIAAGNVTSIASAAQALAQTL
jgi:hypothetical protein